MSGSPWGYCAFLVHQADARRRDLHAIFDVKVARDLPTLTVLALVRALEETGDESTASNLLRSRINERPDDVLALARRVSQMRTGCTRLILSEHPSLSAADSRWLVAQCRAWGSKFDAAVGELEAGTDPRQIRAEVDDLVARLVQELRGRAAAPAEARG